MLPSTRHATDKPVYCLQLIGFYTPGTLSQFPLYIYHVRRTQLKIFKLALMDLLRILSTGHNLIITVLANILAYISIIVQQVLCPPPKNMAIIKRLFDFCYSTPR